MMFRSYLYMELRFRTFKQTFGRRKLRSHKAEHAKLEAEWSLVALWAVCLLAQREIANSGGDPRRLSPAGAIKAIQKVVCHYRNRPDGLTDSLGGCFATPCRMITSERRPKRLVPTRRKESVNEREYPRSTTHRSRK